MLRAWPRIYARTYSFAGQAIVVLASDVLTADWMLLEWPSTSTLQRSPGRSEQIVLGEPLQSGGIGRSTQLSKIV
ncbi:hypothetical protein CEE69_21220 [Rhodopirellula bahusiensis]|uniref:Uncharacterized protein n=1 Tax=Rhodopirellula bahusiensis TaxID=2014065 RepID=A0A2G1W2J7_9BACT|nr:hypothetical protein CEE69_21220 [Rhodopirellula bahusiensis]